MVLSFMSKRTRVDYGKDAEKCDATVICVYSWRAFDSGLPIKCRVNCYKIAAM